MGENCESTTSQIIHELAKEKNRRIREWLAITFCVVSILMAIPAGAGLFLGFYQASYDFCKEKYEGLNAK